jgi:hypothetical protein
MADNITIKDGNGSAVTLKTKDVGGGVECSQSIPSDTSGSPAWGTAGSANANVMTVQGIASGTPLPVKTNTAGDIASKLTDGTNTAAVKAASTAPVATDPALVVSISPNSVNANGQATKANSAPVVLASDQASMSATGSGVPGQADYEGALAKTALPAAGTDGNLVGIISDKFGRQIVLPCTIRDLVATAALTISDTTSHNLLAAQGAALGREPGLCHSDLRVGGQPDMGAERERAVGGRQRHVQVTGGANADKHRCPWRLDHRGLRPLLPLDAVLPRPAHHRNRGGNGGIP